MTTNPIQLDIEALADSLSASADALHTRLMRDIRQKPPGIAIAQTVAQALFENEVALRQRANGLYLDAAVLAAAGLGAQRQQVLELTARAQEKIDKIERIKDLVDIAADLLAVAAGVAGGKPEQVVKPLENLKHHIEAL